MEHPIIITSKGKVGLRHRLNPTRRPVLNIKGIASALGASMVQPIRRSLNYQGIARAMFPVQQLPQGALPIYDRGFEGYKHDAIKISSRGVVYRKGDLSKLVGRVTIPQFQIFSNPTIRISDVKSRRFNLIDRAVHKAKNVIMAQEDSMIFDALDKLGSKNGPSND